MSKEKDGDSRKKSNSKTCAATGGGSREKTSSGSGEAVDESPTREDLSDRSQKQPVVRGWRFVDGRRRRRLLLLNWRDDPEMVAIRKTMTRPQSLIFAKMTSAAERRQRKVEARQLRVLLEFAFSDSHQFFLAEGYYTPSVVTFVCEAVKGVFEKERRLLRLPIGVNQCIFVFGDLHGQLKDLHTALCFAIQDSDVTSLHELAEKNTLVFLGDYVDRGCNSLAVIMLLFTLKILYPRNVVLLRGNHETRTVNCTYGFFDELERYYPLLQKERPRIGEFVYYMCNDVFDVMPLSALVGKKFLCMHGGLSPHLHTLDDFDKIPCPLPDLLQSPLAHDIVWSDPNSDVDGFAFNEIRGSSVFYGDDVVINTLKRIDALCLIRAHQMVRRGWAFSARDKVITLFSASSYLSPNSNMGAFVRITRHGRISFRSYRAEEGRQSPFLYDWANRRAPPTVSAERVERRHKDSASGAQRTKRRS